MGSIHSIITADPYHAYFLKFLSSFFIMDKNSNSLPSPKLDFLAMSETVVSINDANIYQGENLVLENVNFTISRSEFVYLIGKTGSGKSSLLKTLYGELPLKEGSGNVVGFDL